MNAYLNKAEFRIFSGPVHTEYDDAIISVSDAVGLVNEAIVRAVNAGISVELVLNSRFHDGLGNWGDQMAPLLRSAVKPAGAGPYNLTDGEDGICS